MSKPLEIIEDIEKLSIEDQRKVLFYMLSVGPIQKDIEFLKYANKITFGLISRTKVDVIAEQLQEEKPTF